VYKSLTSLELKQSLFQLFSQYGEILEIHARKSFKMKGQAFVVYKDLNSATTARHALNNAIVFGKPVVSLNSNPQHVNYSRNTSDAIGRQAGKFSQKEQLIKEQERRKRRERKFIYSPLEEYLEIKKKTQAVSVNKQKEQVRHFQPKDEGAAPPNNTLFVEELTPDVTENILKTIFGKYNGFREVRLFSGKGMAFVEYDTELNAGAALLGLNNMNLTNECVLHISFAKK
jgi:RNA recognition motif-containing protein